MIGSNIAIVLIGIFHITDGHMLQLDILTKQTNSLSVHIRRRDDHAAVLIKFVAAAAFAQHTGPQTTLQQKFIIAGSGVSKIGRVEHDHWQQHLLVLGFLGGVIRQIAGKAIAPIKHGA